MQNLEKCHFLQINEMGLIHPPAPTLVKFGKDREKLA